MLGTLILALCLSGAACFDPSVRVRCIFPSTAPPTTTVTTPPTTPAPTRDPSTYPWAVGIWKKKYVNCLGALIAPQYVLTTAYCVTNNDTALQFSIGAPYGHGTDTASTIHLHPSYVPPPRPIRRIEHDIAIIQLTSPSTKAPIVLDPTWLEGGVKVSWIGRFSEQTSLNVSNTSTFNTGECMRIYRDVGPFIPPWMAQWDLGETNICAADAPYPPGSTMCDPVGLSLVTWRASTPQLRALHSYIVYPDKCGAGYPPVFARISAAKDFIDKFSVGHTWVANLPEVTSIA
ncbi:hypothetical protein Ae201684P_022292 [Aphanomyces euteiches]|uniref:Peptidase S1 domain-containing protein n=1 Tax=Aphanomyces euteiches TaxID=100861 RepID=A0A6G0X6B6_9STRA|nr:hypothetical protein Ae201684_008144 [Aphanomyces euteiches]KAH9074485.1 hypothetical protein Ae201684P_022292 [Aphanomyces euteiches]KAH9153814.1 hypothetical protein AeRB84_003997 [Aphanomyces euteiches]